MPFPAVFPNTAAAFLEACRPSSQEAYQGIKQLLARLWAPETRIASRRLLEAIFHRLREQPGFAQATEQFHFTFHEVQVPGALPGQTDTLRLLQLPSIFAPEEWSFTFYEGLSRYNTAAFQGKQLCELGSGNGWISIALAKRCLPAKIYGLDINPRAKVCGEVNLFLNGLDAQGLPLLDSEGLSLLDRVVFATSDLLQACYERQLRLDTVIGCIPQVLNPEEEVISSIIPESSHDDYLYALSNYCGKQGYVEDQFGLGLIARTLEEAVDILVPAGRVILNIGGRPGVTVLDRLFERRGYTIRKVWQRKIEQAGDTDIAPLVGIERQSVHRFEFFIEPSSEVPVSAATAQRYAQSGGRIYHALTVYEATLRHPAATQEIFSLLRQPAFRNAKSALDLCFADESVAEEKTSYLAALAQWLKEQPFFPYEHTEGEPLFRARLSQFLNSYFYTAFHAEQVFAAPNTDALIHNLLHIYQPRLALISRKYHRAATASVLPHTEIMEAPEHGHLIHALLLRLRPEIAVVQLAEFQYQTPDAFIRLLEASEQTRTRLFVDISSSLELSSTPRSNGILQYLSEHPLPAHAALVCGFEKNAVYADLQLAVLLTRNRRLLEALSGAAEFTYSRTPILAQHYYSHLLHDLLRFQLPAYQSLFRPQQPWPLVAEEPEGYVPQTPAAAQAFRHPCLEANTLPLGPHSVRLDYGENELPSPLFLKASLFEAFARQHISAGEYSLGEMLEPLLLQRFGIGADKAAALLYANGAAPIFSALAEECLAQGGTFLFPSGAYGYFYATAQFYGVPIVEVPTRAEQGFKLEPEALAQAMQGVERPWLFFNAPIVNPTGAVYAPRESAALLEVAQAHGGVVVLDTIFAGLEHGAPAQCLLEPFLGMPLVLIGGVSKEFAAGGLRLGYAYTRHAGMAQALRQRLLVQPHFTLLFAMKQVYAQLQEQESLLAGSLSRQREILGHRAARLAAKLQACGWTPLQPQGGLFMVASPTAFLGKSIAVATPEGPRTYTIDDRNISQALFHATGLLVNNAVWTGIPGHCRFVLSVSEEAFEAALEALAQFARLAGVAQQV